MSENASQQSAAETHRHNVHLERQARAKQKASGKGGGTVSTPSHTVTSREKWQLGKRHVAEAVKVGKDKGLDPVDILHKLGVPVPLGTALIELHGNHGAGVSHGTYQRVYHDYGLRPKRLKHGKTPSVLAPLIGNSY